MRAILTFFKRSRSAFQILAFRTRQTHRSFKKPKPRRDLDIIHFEKTTFNSTTIAFLFKLNKYAYVVNTLHFHMWSKLS